MRGQARWARWTLILRASGISVLAIPTHGVVAQRPQVAADTVAIAALARDLSSDANRGRGPWTRENERVARQLSRLLDQLGARPVFGTSTLVPFTTEPRPKDTVYNVIGVFPARGGITSGELVGMTAHLDHLGVGPPDATGDSIYNGFLDDAVSIAMILDVARRYVQSPGDRPLVVMFFNLEEQGLLGAKALGARPDAAPFIDRLKLLIGVDAGSPAGEALTWQIMGGVPPNGGARIADSLARAHGWTTTASAPRPINDVFVFAQRGVPIVFPIPGAEWRGYTKAQRDEALRKFDHYHQPSDQWRPDFPWTGTAVYAEWLWEIVQRATDARERLASALSIPGAVTAQASPDSARRAQECPSCAEWNAAQAPLRIFGNTFYVGTHGLASVLITSPQGHVLIDGALPESAPLILAHIRALGFRVEDVKIILNSHAHYDHAGGISALQAASGAAVEASPWSAAVIRRGTSDSGDPQFGIGLPYPPLPSVRTISDGQLVRVGDLALTAHFTGGHTPGGTTWSWRSCAGDRCLDLVYADSQTPVSADAFLFTRSATYSTGVADFEHSFSVLENLACDILITPHPSASSFWERIAARDSGNTQALVDSDACRRYAASARRQLADRIAREKAVKH